jgi:group I intron endonuclease
MRKVYGRVYLIRCRANGLVYVGQTTQSVEVRWKLHMLRSKRDTGRLYEDIRKYGIDAFEVTVLATAFNRNELNALERQYIHISRATDLEHGYNTSVGMKPFDFISWVESRYRARRTGAVEIDWGKLV